MDEGSKLNDKEIETNKEEPLLLGSVDKIVDPSVGVEFESQKVSHIEVKEDLNKIDTRHTKEGDDSELIMKDFWHFYGNNSDVLEISVIRHKKIWQLDTDSVDVKTFEWKPGWQSCLAEKFSAIDKPKFLNQVSAWSSSSNSKLAVEEAIVFIESTEVAQISQVTIEDELVPRDLGDKALFNKKTRMHMWHKWKAKWLWQLFSKSCLKSLLDIETSRDAVLIWDMNFHFKYGWNRLSTEMNWMVSWLNFVGDSVKNQLLVEITKCVAAILEVSMEKEAKLGYQITDNS